MAREFRMSPEEIEDHPIDTLFDYFSILNLFDNQVERVRKRKSKR